MRNIILLVGGYGLDIRNASAIRAFGLAHMFESIGFKVVVIGKLRNPPDGARGLSGFAIDDVTCRDIKRPIAERSCASYVVNAEGIFQVVDELGSRRIRAIICYNYPARGALSTIIRSRICGIPVVLDCTEWCGWEGQKVLRNLFRLSGVEFRMRFLTRAAGNVICASSWLRTRLSGQHTVRLPFVLDTTRPEWQRGPVHDPIRPAHLIYSGSPGLGMYKDRLPVMIASLARLANAGQDFRISIAGVTELQYLETVPEHRAQLDQLGGRLQFLGRIPHTESLSLLRSADFSVFFRQPNRVSNTGFATKYVEAATLGVPVISNPTSDLPLYLRDGENGIMARSIADADVDDALRRAISLTPEQRATMVAACRAENPFDMRAWQGEAREFLENLQGLR